jgi:hypothetical protein
VSTETTGTLDDTTTVTVESGATLTDSGALTVGDQATLTDAGAIAITGSGSLADGGSVSVAPTGALDDGHSLTVKLGATLDDGHSLTVDPLATLDDGGTMTVGSAASLGMRGTLQIEANRTLDVSGTAVLAGTSQQPAILAASLTNAATPVISLHPGAALNLDTTGAGTTELNLPGVNGFVPTPGQQVTLVANATGSAVQGLFDDPGGKPLNELDVGSFDPFTFKISYQGGQGGHDVVLTSLPRQFSLGFESHLSVPVKLDGQDIPSSGPVLLVPGSHTLTDPNGAGASVEFSVTPAGTLDISSAPPGVLSIGGTTTLVINGRTMTIDTRPLSVPTLTLDGSLSVSNTTPFTFTDLPGTYTLADSGGAKASVQFTLTAEGPGTVGYDSSLEGVLTGAVPASTTLVVHGVSVQIQAQALLGQFNPPPVIAIVVDGQPPSTAAVQTVSLLPGAFTILYISPTGLTTDTLSFSVSVGDQVTYNGSDPISSSAPLAAVNGTNVIFLFPPPR